MLRLRISLPDRPGSLGTVSRALGALGADIVAVTVLEHGTGRVLDEFTVTWPGYPGRERLVAALATIPGVQLEGAWSTAEQPDSFGDLDVLGHITADPARALPTLVDALPGIFSADWAILVGAGAERAILHASAAAPATHALPEITAARPLVFSTSPTEHLAAVPIGLGRTLYLARCAGPAFHRIELARLARVVEIALGIAGQRPLGRPHADPARFSSGSCGRAGG